MTFLLIGLCLISALELRLYPSDFKQFRSTELRWPQGNNLELTCEIEDSNSDQYRVVWYLPHVQGRDLNTTDQNGRSVLRMNKVSAKDNGRYECKAEKISTSNSLPAFKAKYINLHVSSLSGKCMLCPKFPKTVSF